MLYYLIVPLSIIAGWILTGFLFAIILRLLERSMKHRGKVDLLPMGPISSMLEVWTITILGPVYFIIYLICGMVYFSSRWATPFRNKLHTFFLVD